MMVVESIFTVTQHFGVNVTRMLSQRQLGFGWLAIEWVLPRVSKASKNDQQHDDAH